MTIIGNERVKRYLEQMVHSDTIGQALLFSGPEGVGKGLVARTLARALLCKTPEAMTKFDVGAHPDFHIYKPEGRGALHSIHSMREIAKEVHLPPSESDRKIFLIEEADKMVSFSSNALLKTFEEPTPDTLIILLTSQPAKILPTIVSRCRRVMFAPLSQEEIQTHLVTLDMSEKEAASIAKRAHGSMKRALLLKEGKGDVLRQRLLALLAKGEHVNYLDVRAACEEISAALEEQKEAQKKGLNMVWKDRLKEMPASTREAIEKEIEGTISDTFLHAAEHLLEELLFWYRDLHLLKETGETDSLYHSDHIPELINLEGQGKFVSLKKVQKLCQNTLLSIRRFTKLSTSFEALLMALLHHPSH